MSEPAHQIEPLITREQAAEILGMGVHWVSRQAARGTIPSYKWGHSRRFRASELEAWLAARAEGERETIASVTPLARRR